MRGEKEMDNEQNVTQQTNENVEVENSTSKEDLSSYFEKLSENLSKQMERYFISNSKKESNNYGLTEEQMKQAANDYLNNNKSKETILEEENKNLRNQMKEMKTSNSINEIFNKLEVNMDLKDDLLKIVNINDFYNEKDELKTEDFEKSLNEIIERIPNFKKTKQQNKVDFGQVKNETKTQTKKSNSMEDIAREFMGLKKK